MVWQGLAGVRLGFSTVTMTKSSRVKACLRIDGVYIVGIATADCSHWVLAVGVSAPENRQAADSSLILDTDAAPVPMAS